MTDNRTFINNKHEKNIQKRDFNCLYRSNSQMHYKCISNNNYENRIRLNPSGEYNTHDIRYHVPVTHIRHYLEKSDCFSRSNSSMTSFDNAEAESKIASHIQKQKYQKLLEKDKQINHLCQKKNKEIQEEINKKKEKLKKELTRIINDALLFSKKNNSVKSMLPENINEIVEKAKKETQDMSLSLNISNLSKISSITADKKKPKKIEFLSLIGVDVENMKYNHININIDKAWKFIKRISKGRNIEEILRFKVVNAIMSMTEKKASEKARQIYDKLKIYKNYMNKKKEDEKKRKQMEEEEKFKELLNKNPKELIRQKMVKSLSQAKVFNKLDNTKEKEVKEKKLRKSQSVALLPRNKTITKYNSYRDVDKIINFIDSSNKNSQSQFCKEHFLNIQMTKEMDLNRKNILTKNEIYLK